MKERVLGLIPAKGSSSRLPKKNIQHLGDKMLIEWARNALTGSGVVDRLILSTESEEIAQAARMVGIDVPYLRPNRLARNPAGVVDVGLHALNFMENDEDYFSTLIITLPTCPFCHPDDIKTCYEIFLERGRPFVMSISEYPHTPFAALKLGDDGSLTHWFPEYLGRKSQEMPSAFRPNGGVCVLDVNKFKEVRTYFGSPLIGYVMPRERSVDIDTAEDLIEAEAWLNAKAIQQ